MHLLPQGPQLRLNKTWVEIYTGGTPETTGNEYLLDNSGVSCSGCDNTNKYETF
jgi:hypothetical protein